jgi:hypothetical protein
MATQGKFLPNLSGKNIALILEYESNPVYFGYLWVIVLNAYKQGSTVTIFDCDWDIFQFTCKNHDPLRKTRISQMRDKFLQSLSEITKNEVKIRKIEPNEIEVKREEITAISDFSDADTVHFKFGNSMRSVFARNYLSSSNFNLKGLRMKKQFRTYVHSFLLMKKFCEKALSLGAFDLIVIANGRFPSQTAMRLVAENASVEFYFYEHGMPKGQSFHFAKFQTQEFQKMQEFKKAVFMPKNQEKNIAVLEFSRTWLDRQENDIVQNPFLNLKAESGNTRKPHRKKPLAVFFNSSIDEKFSNLGVDLNGWRSQKHATSSIAKRLLEQGFDVIVRIHPNTANKSWWDLINIVSDLEENGIDYILPWNTPTSYELLKDAAVVLTWGSTISMEALSRGIPTVVYGRTMFDEIAGAFILTPALLEKTDFRKLASPNPALGFLAAYVNKNWGYKLTDYCVESELVQLEEIFKRSGIRNAPSTVKSDKESYHLKIIEPIKSFIVLLRRLRQGRYSTANDFRTFFRIFFGEKAANLCADSFVRISLKLGILSSDGEVSI